MFYMVGRDTGRWKERVLTSQAQVTVAALDCHLRRVAQFTVRGLLLLVEQAPWRPELTFFFLIVAREYFVGEREETIVTQQQDAALWERNSYSATVRELLLSYTVRPEPRSLLSL